MSGAPQPRAHPAAGRPAGAGESDRRATLGGALPAGEAGGTAVGAQGGPGGVEGGRVWWWMIRRKLGDGDGDDVIIFWGFDELHGDVSIRMVSGT